MKEPVSNEETSPSVLTTEVPMENKDIPEEKHESPVVSESIVEPKPVLEEEKTSPCQDLTEEKESEKTEIDPDTPKKVSSRPRKTDPISEDDAKLPRLSNGTEKTDIKHSTEEVLAGDEICRVSEATPEPNAEEDSFNDIDLDELKSGPSSENDGGSSEIMLLTKSDDSKSKENSESETRVSSASENGVIKAPRRRKRRKDLKWYPKKKRKYGICNPDLSPGMGFEWREVNSSSPAVNGHTQKKSREFAIPSPSLADISMKPAIPEPTATSLEMPKGYVCLCKEKPHVFVNGNNNTGDLYCQALDCIDNRIVGCCNAIPSQDVGLYRASEKTPYQMMCDVHQQRLFRHNSCPHCGLFCTQGRYYICKFFHHFHRTCVSELESGVLACPHCGDISSPKEVILTLHSDKDPVFLPHQKPIREVKSAKITIVRGDTPVVKDEEPILNFPTPFLPSDATSEDSQINGISPLIPRDKLEPLLNIANKSFAKIAVHSRQTYKLLYNAAVSGDAEKLIRMLAAGYNPNHIFEDSRGQTALHLAAAHGHIAAVHILLQAKAQVNVLDGDQSSPLTAAINANHNDVVKYLLKCGADILSKSEDGMTPLHIAAKCGNLGACYHILNSPNLPKGYIDFLDDGGWTPMVWASEFNHLEVVKFLMKRGSDPFIKDAEQNIALHWAAFGGSTYIVELFLDRGSDINAVNVHGDTPLHIAARQDKYDCVLLLLARGAKSNMMNKARELPRDCAESPSSEIYKGLTLNMELSALLVRFQDRTPKIISNDISKGKEKNQIQCVNGVDDEGLPQDFVYVSESCFTSKITVDRRITSLQYCKCEEACLSDSCNCAIISIKCWYDNDGRLKPEFNYADPPMIFECNQACRCNRITCKNRVVQNGIVCRFQLFRTKGKGWGIKTLNLIPKGTYVCEYVGEIISDCEADHREDDSYLFDLDNRDGETYCIDARHYGNFARFINHMCVPNLMPVHVFVDHQDLRFPRIAFFANRDIQPNEELGYNYGEKFWVIKWKSFTCNCGSDKCMYSESTIKTTLDNYRKKIEENP